LRTRSGKRELAPIAMTIPNRALEGRVGESSSRNDGSWFIGRNHPINFGQYFHFPGKVFAQKVRGFLIFFHSAYPNNAGGVLAGKFHCREFGVHCAIC
jgi:hypothetical protein